MKKRLFALFFLLVFFVTACGAPAQPSATDTPIPADTAPPVIVYITATAENTVTPTITFTPENTATPTITFTATITETPTFSFPTVTVNKQAHCRYGPSSAYLHAADLYAGDTGTVRGRALYSNWLYIKFDKINYHCWVSPSVVDVIGDVKTVKQVEPNLQSIGSNQYGPPQNVQATRNGDEVTITWDQMEMTADKDRGYLIEAFVCQNGGYIWWTFSYPDQYSTSYTVQDEAGCASPSSGKLYTVEKHGFSQPAIIPWPAP
ncbi:MAG: hypothetical protein JNK32_08330 [Anaerolineales bacterium]|nr:hypothetical protein [Anaerolineales bacterium]